MRLKITTKQVDYLNIFLVVLSLFFALIFPFELFLFAYAILGPLHYLTEINWLHKKNYFTNVKGIIWIFSILALFFSIPFLLKLPFFETFQSEKTAIFLAKHTNNLVYFALIFSIAIIVLKNKIHQIILILTGVILAIFSKGQISNNLLIGGFLTTIIHVYIFTLLFMIYGALKSKSKVGLWASAMVFLVPILIFSTKISLSNYEVAESWKSIFVGNNFHFLNLNLAKIIGASDGRAFYFYENSFLKIQTFIAFAYSYHYLNWFSKTSIIGWHKTLTKKSTIGIAIFWMISVILYLTNYKTGFLLLIFLSTLHVFAEFPLNILSMKGIGEELKKHL
jgi:hypothetical protein